MLESMITGLLIISIINLMANSAIIAYVVTKKYEKYMELKEKNEKNDR